MSRRTPSEPDAGCGRRSAERHDPGSSLHGNNRVNAMFADRARARGIAFILILLTATTLGAQQSHAKPVVYSSMTYVEEAGDVVGTEMLILRTATGVCVSYLEAERAPRPPRIIRGEIRGDSLLFTIPPESAYTNDTHKLIQVVSARAFRGRITTRDMRARIDGDTTTIVLPRKRSAYFSEAARELANASVGGLCRSIKR